MMMEQDTKRVGRQALEPKPEAGNDDGTKPFLGRIENPIQLQSCLGNKYFIIVLLFHINHAQLSQLISTWGELRVSSLESVIITTATCRGAGSVCRNNPSG